MPQVYSWQWLHDLCSAMGNAKEIVPILNTIASSRNPKHWIDPSEATPEQIETRTKQLLDFFDFAGGHDGRIEDPEDIMETRTYRRLQNEYDLCDKFSPKLLIQPEEPKVSRKSSSDPTPMIVAGSLAVLGLCMYYAEA